MSKESEPRGGELDFEKIAQAKNMEEVLGLLNEDPDLKNEIEGAISRPDYESVPPSEYDPARELQLIRTNLAQIVSRFDHGKGEILMDKIESFLPEYREGEK